MIEILSAAQQSATNATNLLNKGYQQFSETQNFLNNTVNTLISPQTIKGINGWLFDVEKTHQIDIEADITDHFMEDNSFINDHKIKKPIIIQVSGFIGELVARKPEGIDAVLNFLANSLSTINAYLGDYTSQASQQMLQIISQVQSYSNTVNQAISKTKNIIKQFEGQTAFETAQGKAYSDLYGFFLSEDLLTIQTPWGIFENMAIQKISLVQPEDTVDASDISITLKEMRFVQTKTVNFSGNLFGSSRNEIQKSESKDLGKAKGDDSDLALDIYSALGGQ